MTENKKPLELKDLNAAIRAIETCALERKFSDVPVIFNIFLRKIESGDWYFGMEQKGANAPTSQQATRLAAAITAVLVDKDHEVRGSLFHLMCRFKRTLSQIFEVSGYRGTGHLLALMGQELADGSWRYDRKKLPVLLAALSINAMSEELLGAMVKLDKSLSFSLLLGFLSEQMLYSKSAEVVRSKMLALENIWDDLVPNDMQVQSMGPAYMGCSYAAAHHKHNIKKTFNKVMRNWMLAKGAHDRSVQPRLNLRKARPKVVIFAEFYHELHAMHRCHGPSIADLKSRFDTVLIAKEDAMSDAVKALVHSVDVFEFNFQRPQELVERIQSHEPDILYLPSVGMRLASIAASVIRSAPIQVMSFGHPATTHSPYMDYVILTEDQIGSLDTLNETVILRRSGKRHGHRWDAEQIEPNIRRKPSPLRIAVPAWSRKVTPVFLETCAAIKKRLKRQVEFVFFPNSYGVLHQAINLRYKDMLDARVLPRTDYNSYIRALNSCDIFLSSFPFGATNGILDASLQGLPIVNVRGPEVHTYSDSHLVKRLDQPAWLTTDSVEEFINAVVRLSEDDALRCEISEAILAGDPKGAFMLEEGHAAEDFAALFEAMYYLHEDIQASGQPAVHHADLASGLKKRLADIAALQKQTG